MGDNYDADEKMSVWCIVRKSLSTILGIILGTVLGIESCLCSCRMQYLCRMVCVDMDYILFS